jgi:hypothetical protein
MSSSNNEFLKKRLAFLLRVPDFLQDIFIGWNDPPDRPCRSIIFYEACCA